VVGHWPSGRDRVRTDATELSRWIWAKVLSTLEAMANRHNNSWVAVPGSAQIATRVGTWGFARGAIAGESTFPEGRYIATVTWIPMLTRAWHRPAVLTGAWHRLTSYLGSCVPDEAVAMDQGEHRCFYRGALDIVVALRREPEGDETMGCRRSLRSTCHNGTPGSGLNARFGSFSRPSDAGLRSTTGRPTSASDLALETPQTTEAPGGGRPEQVRGS